MALEPITRQEKIIAGQDLTPITRMEMFLKDFGGGGGGSVPKPLTYDYMPEGYPTKSVGTVTLMEEQQVAFKLNNGTYVATITNAFKIVKGQTYTINWDGTEYECVGATFRENMYALGNMSIAGAGADTGEPFLYVYGPAGAKAVGRFGTNDTSASHTISVKTAAEVITPMAYDFIQKVSETEPGLCPPLDQLSGFILNEVADAYFTQSELQVNGYYDAAAIEERAIKNNSSWVFSPGKFSGAVLSYYNNVANKYITFVLSNGYGIECWKFSQGSTVMEQLWGISKDGVIISSSTANSTKKFRITVDDSGTLKATELTST